MTPLTNGLLALAIIALFDRHRREKARAVTRAWREKRNADKAIV